MEIFDSLSSGFDFADASSGLGTGLDDVLDFFGEDSPVSASEMSSFTSSLGDTVGTASTLLGFAKKALGTGADILGGGGGEGSQGFVPARNTALETAIGTHTRAISQATERQEVSRRGEQWQNRNTASNAIIRGFNKNTIGALHNRILAASRASGSRVAPKARTAA